MALPPAVELCFIAADRLGLAATIIEPEFGYLFELADGRRRITLFGGRSPLNDAVAAHLCEDKHYAAVILERAGFRVPATVRCIRPNSFRMFDTAGRDGMTPGLAFAETNGYPLVVKPNRLSSGIDVTFVPDADALPAAITHVWKSDYIALVQPYVAGDDLRLDFLDGELLVGYRRRPGEGGDPHILNLNCGAVLELVEHVSDAWLAFARRLADAMRLRHFGVDVRLPAFEAEPTDATVLEVNASPALVQLFRSEHRAVAVAAQMRVLRAIMENDRL